MSVIESRIDALLAQMTLEEKVGQMNQASNSSEVNLDDIRKGNVGSMICATSAYAGNDRQERLVAGHLNSLQRVAVEKTRLGIPLLFARDVIHGHRTVFPIPLGQAATWSPESVEAAAAIAANEARADGIHWTFTPMMDIARDPRWGRIAEGFGEDPWLASRLVEAAVAGYQGDDLSAPDRMMACAKHFVGYGAAEGGRDYNTAEISESTLRNVYLPPFHAAAQAGVGSFMSAFNEIGAEPVTASHRILTEILKDEWSSDAVVVSDWNAVAELIEHGVAADAAEAARLATIAGVDIDMTSWSYVKHLADEVRAGRVDEAVIDAAVRRVLRAKFRLGLFERPYTDETRAARVHLHADHLARARQVATEGMVLLKNDGVLPLAKDGVTYGVFGPLATVTDTLFGTWTLDGLAEDVTPILDSIRAVAAQPVLHATLPDDAVSLARYADVVIAILGESAGRSGEDNCVTTLELPAGQLELLRGLRKIGKPIVAVVIAGRPLELGPVLELVDGLVWSFHPGIAGGAALADVLFGDAEPSGKLPVTFPRTVGQVPIHYNHKRTGRPLPVGSKRTRYIDNVDTPQFPFGFGLHYTTFEYGDLTIDGLSVSVTVTNTGERSGEEIVQLYIRDDVSSQTRPVKELKGFRRVAVLPGESQVVTFDLTTEDLAYYLPGKGWVTEPGTFTVWVGPDSQSGLVGSLTV
jgi:beta-glucosidase